MNPYESPQYNFEINWEDRILFFARWFFRFAVLFIAVEYGWLVAISSTLGATDWMWKFYGIGVAGCVLGFTLLRAIR